MSNAAWTEANGVEAQGQRLFEPWLASTFPEYFKVTHKEFQKLGCDYLANYKGQQLKFDLKVEKRKSPNLFLETWSNRSRRTHGWMHYFPGPEWLAYLFLETADLYVIDFKALQCWFFDDGACRRYQEKCQGQYDQKNDTWGAIVPIQDIWVVSTISRQHICLSQHIEAEL